MADWESRGWEVATWGKGRFLERVILRKAILDRRRGFLTPTGWLVMALVAVLLVTLTGVLTRDYFSEVRSDARAAVRALKSGDLAGSGQHLAVHRGEQDFAFYFASNVTPRDIGDALGTVAGSSEDAPFRAGVDVNAYEIVLTDLAGTLALATHGRGKRNLPPSWTEDFVAATTTPLALYGQHDGFFDREGKLREKQDLANKANLLLVLSRGYWSTEFLQAVTRDFHAYDVREGKGAWPKANPGRDVKFAPAPSGVYLTDGILALTAALTANPAASEWAFTSFLPGSQKIAESDYAIGKFTHYLLFEHRFAETPDGDSVGVTAVLTALAVAIESTTWASGPVDAQAVQVAFNDVGPLHDAAVLQALAQQVIEVSGCSWAPRDYWNCTRAGAGVVWRWAQRWGHVVLEILSEAPALVGPLASATNTTWYAIEGDFEAAGLSLATALPGIGVGKIAKSVKGGLQAQRAASEAAHVAQVTRQIQAGADPAMTRVLLKSHTRAEIEALAPRDAQGRYIDPNTGQSIVGKPDIGHKPGYEWRCTQAKARHEGWSRQQLIDYENDPSHYQLEAPSSNRSRAFEAVACAP
ncbi:GH-E family nuclease [Ornithinimicrobium avium]|uniref:GH-E family nuclease n=1 Tax=Ornithinimicrobium avium TaxID=2283195 RepID=UPI0013B3E116|nr:GH-E family nuclease [Ornithinimicrobium avium]